MFRKNRRRLLGKLLAGACVVGVVLVSNAHTAEEPPGEHPLALKYVPVFPAQRTMVKWEGKEYDLDSGIDVVTVYRLTALCPVKPAIVLKSQYDVVLLGNTVLELRQFHFTLISRILGNVVTDIASRSDLLRASEFIFLIL